MLRWLIAFSPAIFVLLHILPLRLHVPYHDSWAFVKQYQDWVEGRYGWSEFFAPHNNHPSVSGKLIYFGVLHFFGGDTGLLALVTWGLALLSSLAVLGLSRSWWRGHPGRGAALMLLANLSLFTLAQGHTWIWDFVFQNAISSACLVAALWALSGERMRGWRWTLAALLAVTASFSFGTGPVIGFLLLPAVWWAASGASTGRRVTLVGAWVAISAVAGWLALRFFVPAGGSVTDAGGLGRAGELFSRPLDALQYVLTLLGHTLGQGTVVEPVQLCAWCAAILLVVFVACAGASLLQRDSVLRREAWPWIAIGLWAVINALAICFGRMRALLETALAPRYGGFMLFFVLATVMLAAWTISRLGDRRVGRVLRAAAAPAVAVLLILHLLAWKAGADSLEIFRRRMNSEFAALAFTNALPPQRHVQWQWDQSDGTAKLVRFLKSQDRLPGVTFVEDGALSRWRIGEDSSDKWAHWELVRHDDGTVEMAGVCGLTKDLIETPDLVVITASTNGGAENIVALAAPRLPDDFLDRALRRREHYEHYFAWRWGVDRAMLPSGSEVTLRAYIFDREKRRVRKIKGEAKLPSAVQNPVP